MSTILERNAREHQASFVLFTGNASKPGSEAINLARNEIYGEYSKYNVQMNITDAMASARISYKEIMNSHNSFRVTTNEGVDADDGEDGMRRRLNSDAEHPYDNDWYVNPEDASEGEETPRIFQGFKYGDLPSTYVIGDGVVYDQRQSDTQVDFSTTVDLSQMYPEAEYYLNDRLRQWVRKIRRTVINRQILPVYTSMEVMTKNVHMLTLDDMKSITFQVVPSFYWKYEWSYNEFMIHRVGKLNPTSNNIVMYDMLGNVWEWVRDDWSDHVSDLDGKVNPMVGGEPFVETKAYSVGNLVTYNGVEYVCIVAKPTSITNTPDRDSTHWKVQDKKVIKGGAFNQLLRKVVSAAREGLEKDKSVSQYGSQNNVGFRPSLTFIAENEGGDFEAGKTPIDLFFLFDASASQDNGIQEMLKQAKSIVKMFAGTVAPGEDEPAVSAPKKDICHVGSALFMGNSIKLMCSAQCKRIDQVGYIEQHGTYPVYYEGHEPKNHLSYIYYNYYNKDKWSPHEWEHVENTTKERHKFIRKGIIEGRKDWVKLTAGQPHGFSSGFTADEKTKTGLLVKFNRYKEDSWMAGDDNGMLSPKSIDGQRTGQLRKETVSFDSIPKSDELKDSLMDFKAEDMVNLDKATTTEGMALRDGPGGGGGHSPPSCFVSGTKVLMSSGKFKNIEDIKVGDMVVSRNLKSSVNECCLVE